MEPHPRVVPGYRNRLTYHIVGPGYTNRPTGSLVEESLSHEGDNGILVVELIPVLRSG